MNALLLLVLTAAPAATDPVMDVMEAELKRAMTLSISDIVNTFRPARCGSHEPA